MIAMRQHPDETSRTPNKGCTWIAECRVEGQAYAAGSRKAAPFALARVLVEAGIPDQPVEVVSAGLAGSMRYRSLHRMAGLTITESATKPVRLTRWQDRPDFWRGKPQNRGESTSEVSEYRPAQEAAE